ncbi:anti-sigma factor [Mesorhizobium sp. BAC0120]|uniref:anti-sigma factor family protein n=1 Tax=Mesorhizobium sp. BAC0120 TaxID=3090670 RepID=UPI00298C1BA7|nr:anti-sigma factor [Mesorhizobium sp. BAC0120]MDW6025346.1 anti-sigma factor [Mesorhizobium sp. BAC0120]
MAPWFDPVSEQDLDAYVDDQLDAGRRIEVEAFLSAHPEMAARVMSDLRARDELRLAFAVDRGMSRPGTAHAARKLERGLARDRILGTIHRMAAIMLIAAGGWLASKTIGPMSVTEVVASPTPPAYVEEAMRAYRTSVLRASMTSQSESPDYDANEIRAATAIVMPKLPKDWKVSDVQIYPSQFGPSVEMTASSEGLGLVSLFAVRPGTFDVVKPTIGPAADISSAYFQIGEVAYVLVARGDVHDLDRTAERLSDTLY